MVPVNSFTERQKALCLFIPSDPRIPSIRSCVVTVLCCIDTELHAPRVPVPHPRLSRTMCPLQNFKLPSTLKRDLFLPSPAFCSCGSEASRTQRNSCPQPSSQVVPLLLSHAFRPLAPLSPAPPGIEGHSLGLRSETADGS